MSCEENISGVPLQTEMFPSVLYLSFSKVKPPLTYILTSVPGVKTTEFLQMETTPLLQPPTSDSTPLLTAPGGMLPSH